MLTILQSLAVSLQRYVTINHIPGTFTTESTQVTKPEISKDRPFEMLTLNHKISYNEMEDGSVDKHNRMMIDQNAEAGT